MGNEGQQAPRPEREAPEKQEYYGWQYDQDDATELFQRRSSATPSHAPSPQPPVNHLRASQMPAQYQEPIQDMGTSLGYGQGMEYQYFDTPQPSQPIPQLRQERLQQLREERMRRQQRRMRPDSPGPSSKGVMSQSSDGAYPLPLINGSYPAPQAISGPLPPAANLQPIRSSTSRPLSAPLPYPEAKRLTGRIPAAAPAEDTGMIQRVRIGKATLILTGAFIASRVLGLLRNSIFAFVFGQTMISDAYLQAFVVPDLIFNMIAGGALSSAFIPIFTKYMVGEKDEKTAWHIASSALNLALGVMVLLAALAIIFANQLVPLYNIEIRNPAELTLIVSLTRIMFLQSVVLGGGVIVSAVLNARQDFRLPAIGTVLYNVGLILGLLPGIYFAFRGQRNDTVAVYAATWGVVIGALLQIGIQVPGLFKVGMRYKPTFDWRHPAVLQIGRQMVPRIINAAMLSFSTIVDRNLILFLTAVTSAAVVDGLITQYYQAFTLMLLPLGIFGQSVATAAFPTLAENVAKGRMDRVRNTILETLRSILFMSIPSSVGLIVLGLPIIQALLQHGRFPLDAATGTAVPLAFFAVGLAGHASVEILTRAFYAMRDSTTPVIISVGQFIFKIALSVLLIDVATYGVQWGVGALAFSTSVAALLEAVVLFWLLHQRVEGLLQRTFFNFIGRVLLASVAMALGLLLVRTGLDWVLSTTKDQTLGITGTIFVMIKLLVELFVGIFIYIRSSRYLGIEELGPVKRMLDRFKLSWI